MSQGGSRSTQRLRVAEPVLDDADRLAVLDTLERGWISGYGPAVQAFEQEFAAACGATHGIATSSGTTALHLALAAQDLEPGDEVLLPSLTIVSVYNAIRLVGAVPVPCDVDPRTWNLDPASVERALTPRTRAIVAVHLYGLPTDLDALLAIARPKGIVLIEDAAEAHGATLDGTPVGAIGDCGCFSFFANKLITCGEGGMVVTSDDRLAARLRSLADLARVPGGRAYVHEGLGFNYRMSALAAALGRSQLRRLPDFLDRRRRTARRYREGLANVPGLSFQHEPEGSRSSCWMTAIRVGEAFGLSAEELGVRLTQKGIDTRPFFHPIHRQPFWTGSSTSCPVAEALATEGLLLPSGNQVTDADVQRVVDAVCGEAGAR